MISKKQFPPQTIQLIALLSVLLFLLGCSQPISIGDREATIEAETNAQREEAEKTFLAYCENYPSRCIMEGNAAADLTVYEFSDYGCSHCKTYAEGQFPAIRDNLIETGEIRYIVIPAAILGNPAATPDSANAMLCAIEQGRNDFHEALFSIQVPGTDPTQEALLQLAESEGLEMTDFRSCVQDERYASEASANRALLIEAGINSTPTLMLNGERVQASYQVLTQAIAAARR
jgi:protein-disulfide isomerase